MKRQRTYASNQPAYQNGDHSKPHTVVKKKRFQVKMRSKFAKKVRSIAQTTVGPIQQARYFDSGNLSSAIDEHAYWIFTMGNKQNGQDLRLLAAKYAIIDNVVDGAEAIQTHDMTTSNYNTKMEWSGLHKVEVRNNSLLDIDLECYIMGVKIPHGYNPIEMLDDDATDLTGSASLPWSTNTLWSISDGRATMRHFEILEKTQIKLNPGGSTAFYNQGSGKFYPSQIDGGEIHDRNTRFIILKVRGEITRASADVTKVGFAAVTGLSYVFTKKYKYSFSNKSNISRYYTTEAKDTVTSPVQGQPDQAVLQT